MATAARKTPATGRRGNQEAVQLQAALKPEVPVFDYPPDLKEEHKPYWVDIVNTKAADYWARGDIVLLKMYCRNAYEIDRLTAIIDDEGVVIENARGNPVVNPHVVARGFCEARLMALATKLRMQPSSRVDPRVETKQNNRRKSAEAAADRITGKKGPSVPNGQSSEQDEEDMADLLAGANQNPAGARLM